MNPYHYSTEESRSFRLSFVILDNVIYCSYLSDNLGKATSYWLAFKRRSHASTETSIRKEQKLASSTNIQINSAAHFTYLTTDTD